jgi:hypothetical protein
VARGPIPDKPADRPKVPEVLKAANAFLADPRHIVGGALHMVLEDGNWQDGHIEYCRKKAVEWCHCRRKPCQAAIDLCDQLLALTGTQRRRIAAMVHHQGD